jgi:CRP-like cAMP-binding protein
VLGLTYPLRDILAVYQGLTSGNAAMRSGGFELLAGTLSRTHRRLFAPLADPELSVDERAHRGADLFDGVIVEDRDAVLERLAGQVDKPWLATVAAVASGRRSPDTERRVRKPYHLHRIPGTGKALTALLAEDGTMLKLVERADFLRDVELFSDVRTEDLAKIAAIAQEREYADGATLFAEGEEGSQLYLVVSGQIRVTRRDEVAFIADRSESVGTPSLIDARPREFTAQATRHTRVLVIERDDFYDLMRDHFDLVEGLLVHLTDVVRRLNERIEVTMRPGLGDPHRTLKTAYCIPHTAHCNPIIPPPHTADRVLHTDP